jgi:hypothetical protein
VVATAEREVAADSVGSGPNQLALLKFFEKFAAVALCASARKGMHQLMHLADPSLRFRHTRAMSDKTGNRSKNSLRNLISEGVRL